MKRMPAFDAEQFRRDGFQVIANVFSRDEVEAMRQAVRGVIGAETGITTRDLLSIPALRPVLLDDRMLRLARLALGTRPCYYGDSSANIGMGQASVWHKDNADRNDAHGPDFRGPYTVLRFGLYLQDHARYSGGVNVRQGSHRPQPGRDLHAGETVYVASQPGDVVMWPLTMTHAAKGVQLRFPRRWTVEPSPQPHLPGRLPKLADRLARRIGTQLDPLPGLLLCPPHPCRMAIFMDFAQRGPHLDRNLAFLKTREYMVEIWRNSQYDAEALAALQGKDVELYDYWSTIKDEPGIGLENFYATDAYYRGRGPSPSPQERPSTAELARDWLLDVAQSRLRFLRRLRREDAIEKGI